MSIKNIEYVLNKADTVDINEGKKAYFGYNKILTEIANHYEVGFVQTVACFVALSPNNDYMGNLRSTVGVIQGFKAKKDVSQIKVSTYNACKIRAFNYLTGNKDFLIETKGPKTRSFYFNIIKPEDSEHITIDGHMFGLYQGKRVTMVEVAKLGFNYQKVARDFKIVARKNKLIPNQLQAILWFTWKRINKVIYTPQLNLLEQNNHWGLSVPIDQIIPFGESFK